MIFFRDYLRVLVPLFIAFTAYHVVLVPMLEPRTPKLTSTWVSPAIPVSDDWWEEFFVEGDWQLDKKNPPRVVKTETATLLFQTREQISDRHWLVKPISILLPQRQSGTSKRAVLIKNNDGAKIEFKSAVDWTQELPPIINGQLLGEISIYSPPDDSSKNNGMLINTRDVRINNRVISTTEQIKIQLGNSIVDGRDLSIHMDKDLLTAEQPGVRNDSPFNGLDRLELTYVDRVFIGLELGGLLPRKDIPDIAKRTAYATLKCQGAFEFNFHQSEATLKKNVHMEHIVQGLPLDTFDCEQLQLQVGWQGNQTVTGTPTENSGSNWKVERLIASGALGKDSRDHSGWLRLNAPGMQVEAHGQHLVMDLINGITTLSNRLPLATAREMTPVYLRRESVQVRSPEIEHQSAEAIANSSDSNDATNGKLKSNRLGALQATGPGSAQMENNGESWKISWGERLLVRPDSEDVTKDLVDIKGSANISSPTHGRFIAEHLYLWLTPMTPELATQLAPLYPDGKVPQALPDRMMADGKVDVDSPQIRATVEKMQVWFAYQQPNPLASVSPLVANTHSNSTINSIVTPTRTDAMATETNTLPTGKNTATSENLGQQALVLLPSTGSPAAPLKQPTAPINRVGARGLTTANPTSPFRVTARMMQAKVLRSGNETRIEDLVLDGNFALTKDQVSDESPWPLAATGERLRLSQGTNGTSDISIFGQPAKVAVGSGWVQSPEINLKQSENQFWIDHPGELVIPFEAIQKNFANTGTNASLVSLPGSDNGTLRNNGFSRERSQSLESGSNIRWHEPPRLQWGNRMTFDGRVARFGGGVTLNCRMETDPQTLWHIEAHSNQLSVQMEQPVSLRSDSPVPQRQPQIAVIRLEDDVDIRAVQTDLKMRRRSIEQMKVPQLDMMVSNQTWLGHGPGEIWSRRLGNDNPINGAFPSSSPTNSTTAGRFAENTYQCIHLSFLGRMEGNMAQRSATFYERIEALIGPIASWDEALNVHSVDRPGRNQSLLYSDQLNIFDASGLSWNQSPNKNRGAANNAAWEFEAASRVQMQSNTESGDLNIQADSLKYAAITDSVKVEGSRRQPAHISKSQINSPPLDLQVLNAALRLKTGEIDMQFVKFATTMTPNLQPGNTQPGNVPLQSQPAGQGASKYVPSLRDVPIKPFGRN